MSARRPILRWATRTFRREWRQQLLVLALLSVVAAAGAYTVTLAHNVTPSRADLFGSAPFRYRFDVEHPDEVDAFLADVADHFGVHEVIRHREVLVPGTSEVVELRTFGSGRLSAPMISVVEGRRPQNAGEVALSDGVASLFDARVGDVVGLEGRRTVVGIVENPAAFGDEHALVADASPEVRLAGSESLTVLVDAAQEDVRTFRSRHEPGPGFLDERSNGERTTAVVLVLVMTTVALLLVGLIAAAGFVVVAQ